MSRGVPALSIVLAVLALAACDALRSAPPLQRDYPLKRLGERVYVIEGPNESPSPSNQGFTNNPGFVLTKRGVVIIDPGASVQVGEMLLAKIASVTSDPVIAVLNTHGDGNHWLANAAIKARFPRAVVYAHAHLKSTAVAAGERWLTLLLRETDGAVRGTRPVGPDITLEGGEVLKLGDRRFRVHQHEGGHSPGAIMIEVVEGRVLFASDYLVNERSAARDRDDLLGQMAAVETVLATAAEYFVPGHGPVGDRSAVLALQRDLSDAQREGKSSAN